MEKNDCKYSDWLIDIFNRPTAVARFSLNEAVPFPLLL